ncbi:hypothetical protein FBZ98_107196 [Rhizobium sp. ERR 922]|nr:hypothetical protein FBZ98_107196 [Rhizobium sp. ERR 922]TWB91695.1 hypothetical protein FBZ97_107196 [Rhizobium sp. ERR 942]
MSVIAPTLSHVLQNIERFKAELDSSADLRRRLAYARAWYALQTEDGKWLFAPDAMGVEWRNSCNPG